MYRGLSIAGCIIIVALVLCAIPIVQAAENESNRNTDTASYDIVTILSNLRADQSSEYTNSVIPLVYSGYSDRLFTRPVPACDPEAIYKSHGGYAEERLPDYELQLRSRFVTPTEGIARELTTKVEGGHAIIQFNEIPNDKSVFESNGVILLSYLPHNCFSAYIPADSYTMLAANSDVRAVLPFEIDDKFCPLLRENGVPVSLRNPDGTVRLLVLGFADADKSSLETLLASFGTVTSISNRKNMFAINMLEEKIDQLASEDAIQWIERGPSENELLLDAARTTVSADVVQAAPYNLSGDGVTLAIWDGGWADINHDDFAGRIVRGDTGSSTREHATHVAGIMAGDGTMSDGNLCGFATESDIRTYDWPDLDDANNLDDETDDAIDNGAVLSHNSWGFEVSSSRDNCDEHGNYGIWSVRYDEIINGALGDEISVVCAAGNEENDGDCGPYPWDQLVPPMATAKNTICVGAVYSDTELHTCFSSRGPTNDGRLKPDICAPGDEANDDPQPCLTNDEIRSCLPGDSYTEKGGTSMSAPMISGTIGLMCELYTDLGYGEIKPHTFRAILAMTADDLGNVGPDYTYGHGMLNTQSAVDLVERNHPNNELIRTASVVDDDVITYYMSVPPGAGSIRVAIAWDDLPGDPAAATMLVNDLDLYLRSPSSVSHYAYELDPDNPDDDATRGWNSLDNLEVVQVDAPEPGVWEVRIWAWNVPSGSEQFTVAMPYEHLQCGDTIYHTTFLAEDLICTGDGLTIGADDVYLVGNDFTISGDGGNSDYGVIIEGVENCYVQDCVINNFNRGVYVMNSDSCTVGAYNLISDCYTGVHFESSNAGVIGANTIFDNTDYGIRMIDAANNGIGIINEIYNCKRAIVFSEDCQDNSMLWNSVHDNQFYGILASGDFTANNIISSCNFFGNQYGIRYYGNGTGCSIFDCNIYDNQTGIYAYQTSDFTINDCDIYDNTSYGIDFQSSTSGIEVTECLVCGNSTDIADAGTNSGDSNYCNVVNNWADDGHVSGCDWYCSGCRQPEDGLEIEMNTTLCPGNYSIPDADGLPGVVRVTASDLIIIATDVEIIGDGEGSGFYINQEGVKIIGGKAGNYNFGFQLSSADACTMQASTAVNSDAVGFFLSGSNTNLLSSCRSEDNSSYGFSCGGADNNNFINCDAVDNGKGFYFATATGNMVYNCDITNNTTGIATFNSNSNMFWFNRFVANSTSANETPAGTLNQWNTTVGNSWDDFSSNEGFPFTYVIPGPGDGIDYHPIGAYILVKPDGTGDYPTIQQAINTASNGDVIVLADGTFSGNYNRDIDFLGKEIIVQSLSGNPTECIIDAQGSAGSPHRCVNFKDGEGSSSVLQGITLKNAYVESSYTGAAVFCYNSSPTINNCIFSGGNGGRGGGIGCNNSSPIVTYCTFEDNHATMGGAFYVGDTSEPNIEHATFVANTSINAGGAVYIRDESTATLTNCTFVGNVGSSGSGVFIAQPGNNYAIVNNSIFYSNDRQVIYCSSPGHADLTCCNLYGNVNGNFTFGIGSMEGVNGNISLPPYFCDLDMRDFTLHTNSPCAPFSSPNPECDLIGAWPVACGVFSETPDEQLAPVSVFLSPCRPNPSSTGTHISYGVSAREGETPVSLKIYDPSGHLIRALVDQPQRGGYYMVEWRGFDDTGQQVPGGVYFYRLAVDEYRLSKRVVLLR